MHTLSIIIPARNEKKYIEPAVTQLLSVPLPDNTEILFVEGYSTDGTLAEIKKVAENYKNKINIRYASQDGIGKADAVWSGFNMARNEILLILDADLTVAPQDVPKFYAAITQSEKLFINGSRMALKMEKGAIRPLNYFGNKFFAALLSLIVKRKLTDTLCGTKVIYKRYFEAIKRAGMIEKFDDPFCDFTLLLGAHRLGLEIVEVPISYKRRIYDSTKIRRFRDGWKLLKIVIRHLFT